MSRMAGPCAFARAVLKKQFGRARKRSLLAWIMPVSRTALAALLLFSLMRVVSAKAAVAVGAGPQGSSATSAGVATGG